jgi:hypothetical protein
MPRRSSHRSLESRLTDQTKLLVNAASAAVFNAPTGVGADGDAGSGLRRQPLQAELDDAREDRR